MPDGALPEPLLPAGTRLVHIGPHKTGTTALQASFHAHRAAAEAQGVHYAGKDRHSASAVFAILGRAPRGAARSMLHWRMLLREIRGSQARCVVFSSEFFADAQPDAIRRVVDALDPERVHIAVTVRPLARILSSQWQQRVQSGSLMSFDDFLDEVLRSRSGSEPGIFWHRHRHDELVARWAEVVGRERMTVVALDPRQPAVLLRSFEQLTGLRPGTLQPVDDLANRSFTYPEVEAVRALNAAFRDAGLPMTLHHRVVSLAAGGAMKRRPPGPDEQRIETPQWALDAALEIQREIVANLRAWNVRVIGDLDGLVEPSTSGLASDELGPVGTVQPQVAARLGMGLLEASGLTERGEQGYRAWFLGRAVEPSGIAGTPSLRLAAALMNRTVRTILGPVRALRRRSGPTPD